MLRLGQEVQVNASSDYFQDHKGEVYTLIAKHLEPTGRVTYTIGHLGTIGGRWDDGSDGWPETELDVVQ